MIEIEFCDFCLNVQTSEAIMTYVPNILKSQGTTSQFETISLSKLENSNKRTKIILTYTN